MCIQMKEAKHERTEKNAKRTASRSR
jgi:hypothetical protein